MPIHKDVNKKFFRNWTPEMAYVLGFFAADGYITVNRRGGQFWCIEITDKDILEKIRGTIESNHKISLRPGKGNESDSYRLQIGSVDMCNDLRKLGFREKKAKCLVLPSIPKSLLSHFVRGYFDGDGNVWKGWIHKTRKRPVLIISTVFTSCSYSFLNNLHLALRQRGVLGGCIYVAKGNYCRLQFSCNDSMKLYDFMYNQAGNSLFLSRKKMVFENYLVRKNAAVAQR